MAEPWQRENGGGREPWQRRRLVPLTDPQAVEAWQIAEATGVVEPWQRVIVGGTIPPQENWQLRKVVNA